MARQKKPTKIDPKAPRRALTKIDPKAHRRALLFLNAARAPRELLTLPVNRLGPALHQRRQKWPQIYEPKQRVRPQKLFDFKQAQLVIEERQRLSPLYGFNHIEQLGPLFDSKFFEQLLELILRWFSRLTYGEWSDPEQLDPDDEHFSIVHAAVVKTGDVLFIEHACHSGISRTPLWDPIGKALRAPEPAAPVDGLYCSGHSFLTNGKLLVVGGRGDAGHHRGEKDTAWIFDPDTGQWDYTRDETSPLNPKPRVKMNHPRWYPTLVTLGDEPGRVLVASGDNRNELPDGTYYSARSCDPPADPPPPIEMEVYSETTGKFEIVNTPSDLYFRPTYPGLHLLPGGEIFFAPVGFRNNDDYPWACNGNEDSAYFDFTGSQSGTWTNTGSNDRTKGMSVQLLSCSYPFVQVMVVGGGHSAAATTYRLIDLSTLNPQWDDPLDLPTEMGETEIKPRIHPNVVLLPDGTVFVAGGSEVGEASWLFDPATYQWSQMDALTYERRYHSVAILLVTGEVLATGGRGGDAGIETFEVFKPPYAFRGVAPKIGPVAPATIHHGNEFTIQSPQADDIRSVVLMRPMAVTHQTDSEQRRIELNFHKSAANTLTAVAPNGRHPHAMAPRGWYMLFILNNAGVPSKAEFVRIH